MNIEQANAIPLSKILEKMNARQSKNMGYDLMYFSPFREEKRPSLHVNAMKNLWYDFGMAHGSTVVDLVCTYLKTHDEDYTVADALRWIRNMAGTPSVSIVPFPYLDWRFRLC